MMKVLLIVGILIFSGCFQRSAFVRTKKASAENMSVGHIDKNAPIISNSKSDKPFFIPQESIASNKPLATVKKRELVGYVSGGKYDSDVRLYYYTLTNALKTKSISFFSDRRISYPSTSLLTVNLNNNYLESVKPYHTVIKKRKKSWIGAAKEYFIKVK